MHHIFFPYTLLNKYEFSKMWKLVTYLMFNFEKWYKFLIMTKNKKICILWFYYTLSYNLKKTHQVYYNPFKCGKGLLKLCNFEAILKHSLNV
jgi:hypothetical protein